MAALGAGCVRYPPLPRSDQPTTDHSHLTTDRGEPGDRSRSELTSHDLRWQEAPRSDLSGEGFKVDASKVDAASKLDASKPDLATKDGSTSLGGTLLWSKQLGGASYDYLYALTIDASGNMTLTGSFQGTADLGAGPVTSAGGSDVFVASYASSGAHRWSHRFGSAGDEIGYGVAADASGNVTVVGHFAGGVDFGGGVLTSAGTQDVFIASYDQQGAHRWSRRCGGTSTDRASAVAVDASGNFTVTGLVEGAVNFGGGVRTGSGSSDVFVASYDSLGTHRWSQVFGGILMDSGSGVAADQSGNVTVTGYFWDTVSFGGSTLSSAGVEDVFVASFTSTGAHRWSKAWGGGSSDRGNAVVVDGSGNATVTGHYWGTVDFGGGPLTAAGVAGTSDVFVVSFNPTGGHRWSARFGGASSDYGNALAVDGSGNLSLAGRFQGTVDLGGGPLTAAGSQDLFVASYTSLGGHRWSRRFGGSGVDHANGVAAGASGKIVAGGEFQGTVDFGDGPRASAGVYDAFLVQLAP